MQLRRTFGLLLVLLIALTAVAPALAQMGPSVTAEDQDVTEGTVTVASVVSEGAGWIVIHRDEDGAPGPVVGHAAVEDGENTDVVVTLDEELMGETTLWAMLHEDTGTEGEYEFPDADPPVRDEDDNIVQDSFVASPGDMMEDDGESMEGEDESMEGEDESAEEAPETLPETGGSTGLMATTTFAIGLGTILLLGAFVLRRRQHTIS